jgi:hypothetical protein
MFQRMKARYGAIAVTVVVLVAAFGGFLDRASW